MKKQFKAESKKLMDLMINSIYTNWSILFFLLAPHAWPTELGQPNRISGTR